MTRSTLAGLVDDNGVAWVARNGGGYLSGVDVSHHQTPGNVPLTDVDVLCVRASYGHRPDARFSAHVNAGVADDVPLIQAYHFFRQGQPKGEQLDTLLRQLDGQPCNVVPCVDFEWNEYDDDPSTPTLVDKSVHNTDGRWIVEQIAERFGSCVIYCTPFFWRDTLGSPEWMLRFPFWLAHYTTAGHPKLPPGGELDNWIAHQWQGKPLDRSVIKAVPLVRGATFNQRAQATPSHRHRQ